MPLLESVKIAFDAIKVNKLRTILTCLIIAIGITALVGILTAIDGLEFAINKNFSRMGANAFNIRNKASNAHFGGGGNNTFYADITYFEASQYKERYSIPSEISISGFVTVEGVIKRGNLKTNPNTRVIGVDENYLPVSGSELEYGRNFTKFEASSGTPAMIIGKDIEKALFADGNAVDNYVYLGGKKFMVTGVLKSKGSSMGFGGEDRMVYITLGSARSNFISDNTSYTITVLVKDILNIDAAADEAKSVMRQIRRLHPYEKDNFEVTKSDALASKFIDQLKSVSVAAAFIAAITLLGAAIALLNIMLVSVTDRTKEIGTRKAIGAKPSDIRTQFLTEAIVICQIGGLGGIVMGMGIGNIVSLLMGVGFIVPWNWILVAIIVCFTVGVLAGFYPANKASRLDPIESLRHE